MKKDPYKIISRFYDRVFEPLNRGLRAIGIKMFPPNKTTKVLDVGCGTGAHLELYQKMGCEVFGIDLSPSMIQLARLKLGEAASLYLGDASNMPFSDKTFDIIIISTVLHEMPPPVRSAVIGESKRVLAENGRILLIDFHPGPIKPLKGWISKCIIGLAERFAGGEHFRNYRDFMANHGLVGLISVHGLEVDKRKIVSGGNIAIFLLRKSGENPPPR